MIFQVKSWVDTNLPFSSKHLHQDQRNSPFCTQNSNQSLKQQQKYSVFNKRAQHYFNSNKETPNDIKFNVTIQILVLYRYLNPLALEHTSSLFTLLMDRWLWDYGLLHIFSHKYSVMVCKISSLCWRLLCF